MKQSIPLAARSGNEVKKNAPTRLFSPMNENGCYDFDRVIKSGNLQKRTRKTKVQPTTLSMIRDPPDLTCIP